MLAPTSLLLVVSTLAVTLVSASITHNLAYDSPSFRVRSLGTDRGEVQKRHKRWEYYDGELKFPYGVASGDPWPDSVILWTHPVPSTLDPRPVCLEYQVSPTNGTGESWSTLASGQVWTTSDVDYSYKVEATGLQPKTTYYYRFANCADETNVSPVGRFKTIPEEWDDQVEDVSFAVYSCSNYPFGFFNAYGNVARKDSVDYAVHVGDYIYEYQGDGCSDENACYGDGRDINRVPQPNKEIFTLGEYRQRYATYRSDPDLQLLHQLHAWQLVWDDHEVADNTWKSGSADSNDTIKGSYNGTSFTQRKANAVKAYFEWLPIRTVDTDDKLRIWRTFKFGTLADMIMIDTRQYNRDLTDLYYTTADVEAIKNDDPRSLMGGRQENWLYGQMRNVSTRGAQWKIIGQQIVFAHLELVDDVDAWDGYTANRRRVIDTIHDNAIDNVIVISGDSHANWVSDIAYDNRTGYDRTTGSGAYGVEFAGTGVSSPSSFGYNSTLNGPYPPAYYTAVSQKLVGNATVNQELQWAEGATRGYFELHLSRTNATAKYYGIADVRTRNTNETLLATFVVEDKANKLSRPVAGGEVKGGSLRGSA
ncbi:hypothetical protein EHS25_008403 [Saitozyma podzolica]|uniref:PhoD-like phosphatase metallophosphatase domain-containing protein n=1 Tax=Saitozyma podzolica TaxID=1890683 RepID=A0A427YPG5_9TREE|nr:hypothetical protein EHS25_008403 [Saitozyma podzolica]